jgi:hypothetical protein
MIRNTRMRYRVQRCRCAARERSPLRVKIGARARVCELVRARVPINERLLVSQVKVIRPCRSIYRTRRLSRYRALEISTISARSRWSNKESDPT